MNFSGVNWATQDVAIARQLGRSREWVRQMRRKLNQPDPPNKFAHPPLTPDRKKQVTDSLAKSIGVRTPARAMASRRNGKRGNRRARTDAEKARAAIVATQRWSAAKAKGQSRL